MQGTSKEAMGAIAFSACKKGRMGQMAKDRVYVQVPDSNTMLIKHITSRAIMR